jgi:choline dehydrogenase-like flavoprotein
VSFLDLRDLEAGTTLRADVCVVGAGAAGITVARELIGSGLDVIVVESGGFERHEPTQELYAGEVLGEPMRNFAVEYGLEDLRLRFFGGTTNHWAGYCRQLDDIDFETRPYLPVSGWPLTPADLAPWYERAAETVQLPSTRFDLPWWQSEYGVGDALHDDDQLATSLFQIRFPFSFGAAYRDQLDAATDVRVLLWANATDVVVAPESDRVQAVRVQALEGPEAMIEAGTFVVALGGIENARLLLASNGVRPRGIGNEHDQVGRHFTEHLQAYAGIALFNRSLDELRLYNGYELDTVGPDGSPRPIILKGVLRTPRRVLLDQELLGMEAQLLLAEPVPGSPAYANGARTDDVLPLLRAIDAPPGSTAAFAQVLAEQQLDPESRVTLSGRLDPFGRPRAALTWRHSELDRRSIVAGLRHLGRTLGSSGTGRLQLVLGGVSSNTPDAGSSALGVYAISPEDLDPETFPVSIGFHHMCTTRMAGDPSRGVVDADCRVHELGNLYLAGSSVFATGGAATPTLTLTALAIRLADHLRRTLR